MPGRRRSTRKLLKHSTKLSPIPESPSPSPPSTVIVGASPAAPDSPEPVAQSLPQPASPASLETSSSATSQPLEVERVTRQPLDEEPHVDKIKRWLTSGIELSETKRLVLEHQLWILTEGQTQPDAKRKLSEDTDAEGSNKRLRTDASTSGYFPPSSAPLRGLAGRIARRKRKPGSKK